MKSLRIIIANAPYSLRNRIAVESKLQLNRRAIAVKSLRIIIANAPYSLCNRTAVGLKIQRNRRAIAMKLICNRYAPAVQSLVIAA